MNAPANGAVTATPFIGELAGVGGTSSTSFPEEEDEDEDEDEDEEELVLLEDIFSHNAIKRATGERLETILECLLLV